MKKYIASISVLLILSGCTPTQEQIATKLATIAVTAAATYFGGPAAGQLAYNGLSALASVSQGYVGTTIPSAIIKASPGIPAIGAALVTQIAPTHVVKQSDVDAINRAAIIAKTLAPVLTATSL